MLKNSTGIPLPVAVWLATDKYDYVSDPYYISATTLLKPIRSIVLGLSIPIDGDTDIADLLPSKMGTAVHDGIEDAWVSNYDKAMEALGYPENVINSVVINPTPDRDLEGKLPIYLELRKQKKVGNYTIGGKFDFVADGKLTDFKSTKTYNFISGSNVPDYVKQGSIYRWLNPDIITEDVVSINYIFTDWIGMKAVQDKSYPQKNIIEKNYPLLTIPETQTFIEGVLRQVETYVGKPQAQMPLCTSEELWQTDTIWKYFKDPAKRTRSTKNFDNSADAYARHSNDGMVGVVVEVKGEVKRCRYCNARPVCLQAEQLQLDGLLK